MGEPSEPAQHPQRDPIAEGKVLCEAFMSVAVVVAALAVHSNTSEANVAKVLLGTLSTEPPLQTLLLWFKQRADDVPLKYYTDAQVRALTLDRGLSS